MASKDYLIQILKILLDLRDLLPDDQNEVETYSGKLAPRGIKGGGFDLALKKLESEGIAQFRESLGNSVEGWGTNKLEIKNIDWKKAQKYLEKLENSNIEKWNTDHMPEGYPQKCDTDQLKSVIQDLNDEYVTKKKNGKNNKIWEDIILQQIKSGNEELQRQESGEKQSTQSTTSGKEEIVKLSPEIYGMGVNLKALWRRLVIKFNKGDKTSKRRGDISQTKSKDKSSKEGFLSKFFWYFVIGIAVVVIGGLILNYLSNLTSSQPIAEPYLNFLEEYENPFKITNKGDAMALNIIVFSLNKNNEIFILKEADVLAAIPVGENATIEKSKLVRVDPTFIDQNLPYASDYIRELLNRNINIIGLLYEDLQGNKFASVGMGSGGTYNKATEFKKL